MINYVFLAIVVFGCVIQSVIQKKYNIEFGKANNSNYLYNFIMTSSAFACFLVMFLISPSINIASLPYSLFFAITICMAIFFAFLSIKTGPLALTSLISQFSLLIPTFYDVIFRGYTLSIVSIIGIALLVLSLFFVIEYKKSDRKISKKYILYVFLAFIGNGFCSTIQKMHQIKYEPNANFFMAVAMLLVSLFNLVMFFINKPEKVEGLYSKGVVLSGMTGIFNGIVNFFMIVLSTRLASVILYPTVSAGSMFILFLLAIFIYKERFKLYQYFGYLIGIVSIILLNI